MTASMSRVRELADRAKDTSTGLLIRFTVEEYGSLHNAATAARSFQTVFSSMRARARIRATNLATREYLAPQDVVGPYDCLACEKGVLPNGGGFTIKLCSSAATDFARDVVNLDTGEQLVEFTPHIRRIQAIVALWCRKGDEANREHRPFHNPLSAEDEALLFAHDEGIATDLYRTAGIPTPKERAERAAAPYYVKDALDLLREKGGSLFAPAQDNSND